MALSVVRSPNTKGEPNTQIGSNGSRVVLESDLPGPNFGNAQAELKSAEARNSAIAYAGANGMSNPACQMPGAPYAVDANGDLIVDPINQKIFRYRIDIPLSTRF